MEIVFLTFFFFEWDLSLPNILFVMAENYSTAHLDWGLCGYVWPLQLMLRSCVNRCLCSHIGSHLYSLYRGADKSLARPNWKKKLKVRHFSPDMEGIAAAETWLDGQPSEFFLNGLQKCQYSLFPGQAKDSSAPRYYHAGFPWNGSVLNLNRH